MDHDALNEARIFYLASDSILPLIQSMHDERYDKLIRNVRAGVIDNIGLLASLESLHSLIEEIKFKAQSYEKQLNKENS